MKMVVSDIKVSSMDIKRGSMVCIRNYDGITGMRFGFVEKVTNGNFLVKMQEDKEGYPLHYNEGSYRWYKASKINKDDIVVI
jgi:hypothetical protein